MPSPSRSPTQTPTYVCTSLSRTTAVAKPQRPKLASRRFLAGGHLQAISPWHFTSKNSSTRLLYGVRPTKHYGGNPSEIRDRMLIEGQWWLGLGRNGPVRPRNHGSTKSQFCALGSICYDDASILAILIQTKPTITATDINKCQ